ncbi:MAG TPA: DinB family protein [Fimbriimonadaceae bacterium]|nr:DinB family protein [Fimbriimonadaceae bacterium]
METATAPAIDYKQLMIDTIRQAGATMVKDLRHIPEDKLNVSPMGCARPPLEFVAECAGFNGLIARAIRGEAGEIPSQEQRRAYYASIDTFEKAQNALENSVEALASALEQATDADLLRTTAAPWGEQVPIYRLASLCGYHMSYHDGQLNYIQCLYGDDKFHWMED